MHGIQCLRYFCELKDIFCELKDMTSRRSLDHGSKDVSKEKNVDMPSKRFVGCVLNMPAQPSQLPITHNQINPGAFIQFQIPRNSKLLATPRCRGRKRASVVSRQVCHLD